MRPYAKARDDASAALIDLRAVFEMSQAEFAIKVMDLAPMTISRMETATPPRGDMLLKLSTIAFHAFSTSHVGRPELLDIAARLHGVYLREFFTALRDHFAIAAAASEKTAAKLCRDMRRAAKDCC